ncbi:MAG TPA: Gldg family protein [Pseudobacter sp.]|nr:Gldg family protein [Pseudobacter sp.]
MKTIRKLAKTELSTLFYSPIAWLVLIVFAFQAGLTFTDKLKLYTGWQEAGSRLTFLTSSIFSGPTGFFSEIQKNVYLYIPLLTMGLISRETSSGSIKLLLSSPVKIREIVLGKYLAMMAYCLLLVGILCCFAVAGMFSIEQFGLKQVLSALLGIYLLVCAYSAIGLFMSSLTSYQVVAAVSTLVVLAALNYVGLLWQHIDFVRDITYFLSISGRADQMRDGLITSGDLSYFILVIILFLGLTMMLLHAGRAAKTIWAKVSGYSLLVGGVLLLGYLSSRPRMLLYADMTATRTKTLTAASQEIIRSLDEPIRVTTFVNLLDDFWYMGIPASRNKDISFWAPYQRFMPNLELDYVYYYDSSKADWLYKYNPGLTNGQLAEKMAKARELKLEMFMPPDSIRKRIDLRSEENRFVRMLEYKGRRSFLREYAGEMDPNPGEAEFAAAIKRLLVPSPAVAFLTGDNERAIDKAGEKDYQMTTSQLTARKSLVNQGFDVMEVSLDSGEVPEHVSVLVLADPKKEIPDSKMEKIRRYIGRGGNLLIAGEPGKQQVLNPLLMELGVKMEEGMLLQESKDFSPDLVLALTTEQAAARSKTYQLMHADSSRVSMPTAAGLQYRTDGPFEIMPILSSDRRFSWNKSGDLKMDTGYVQFDPAAGDVKTSLPVAIALRRTIQGRDQKIMVTGDADWMSAQEMGRYNVRVANFFFMMETFRWFSGDQYPVDVSRPKGADNKIKVSKEGVAMQKLFFLGIFPTLLLTGGVVLLVSRKRR